MSSDNGTFQPCHTETLETAKARAELRSMKQSWKGYPGTRVLASPT